MISYVFSCGFDRSMDLSLISDGKTKQLLVGTNFLLESLTAPGHPINTTFFIAIALLFAFEMNAKSTRLGKDILAIFLSVCWLIELISINLLLIAPIKDPVLLMLELLLFLPIIVVSFTWWYWRINLFASFKAGSNTLPIAFKVPDSFNNYLYLSIDTFFKFQPSYVSFNTNLAKLLHLFHAFVKLDVIGLALGRAVSLATSSPLG